MNTILNALRSSIRVRLLLSFGIVAIMPLATMIVLYYANLYDALINAAENELQVGVQETGLRLENFFLENTNNLRSQSLFPDINNYLQEDEPTRQAMEARLSLIFKSLARTGYQAHIQAYLLLDSQGRVLYDQSQRDAGRDMSGELFFVETMTKAYPRVIIDELSEDSRHSIYFSVPIFDESQGTQPVGVLALRYNLSVLRALVSNAPQLAGPESFIILTDQNGHVLAWADKKESPLQSLNLDSVVSGSVVNGFNIQGASYTVASYALADIPIQIIYAKDESAIARDVFANTALIFAISITVILTVVLGAVWVGNQISQPIQALTQTAQELSSGNLNARVTVNTKDEMGILGNTFNRMADQIQAELKDVRAAQEKYRELSELLEQKVAQRTAELQQANKELESFSYSVSHDLRAPLRAIDGYSRILEENEKKLDEESRGYLMRVRVAAIQMGKLIEGLLDLSRLGRQSLRVEYMTADEMRKLVDEIAENVFQDAPERRVEWRLGPLPGCELDRTLFRQVFVNLIGNAFKYTRGRDPAVIEVGWQADTCFVRDNGVGFDMQYAHKLFGVFQRLHSDEEFEGTGVGLATVQRIIEKHGGQIWVQSEPGKGSTFFFTIGCKMDD